jgi:hypothetical protein
MKNLEIEKIVKLSFKDILDRGFNQNKNIIYQAPLEDILFGFCFEKSAKNENGLYVWSFVQPLYVKADSIVLTFGNRLKRMDDELWLLKNNPESHNLLSELNDLMLQSLNTFLSQVNTAEKFYNFYNDKCSNLRMIQAVVLSAVLADDADAQLVLDNYINILQGENLDFKWKKDLLDEAMFLKQSFDDSKVLYKYFEDNIAQTKRALNLS